MMELLEGWGLGSSPEEGQNALEEEETSPTKKWDWKDIKGSLVVGNKKESQTVLEEARRIPGGSRLEMERNGQAEAVEVQEEDRNIPEVREVEDRVAFNLRLPANGDTLSQISCEITQYFETFFVVQPFVSSRGK